MPQSSHFVDKEIKLQGICFYILVLTSDSSLVAMSGFQLRANCKSPRMLVCFVLIGHGIKSHSNRLACCMETRIQGD